MTRPEWAAIKAAAESARAHRLDVVSSPAASPASILRLVAHVERMEAIARDLDEWVTGYETPVTGMGAGMHAEKWPMLQPGARRELRQLLTMYAPKDPSNG